MFVFFWDLWDSFSLSAPLLIIYKKLMEHLQGLEWFVQLCSLNLWAGRSGHRYCLCYLFFQRVCVLRWGLLLSLVLSLFFFSIIFSKNVLTLQMSHIHCTSHSFYLLPILTVLNININTMFEQLEPIFLGELI